MIIGKLEDLPRYKNINQNLDQAIDYLMKQDLKILEPGNYAIDGENVYMNRFDYETVSPEESLLEGHHRYADIHIVIEGCEKIGYADKRDLEVDLPYSKKDDFVKYKGMPSVFYPMKPGCFAITFPEDIHMPKVQCGNERTVKKAVLKVLVSE